MIICLRFLVILKLGNFMGIIECIINRCAVRRYKNKKIPKYVLDKIIEAGKWGPSVHNFQPWKFLVVTNKEIIKHISMIVLRKSKFLVLGYRTIMKITSESILNSKALILIYNSKSLSKRMKKFGKEYAYCAEITEVECISAAIQNMILVADSLKLGSNWLVLPVFCEEQISNLFKINDPLIAILTLGFPKEKNKRANRKNDVEIVKYYK